MFSTVLFDIDGVMLKEDRYFDVSALTVHELLTSPAYLGVKEEQRTYSVGPTESVIQAIRRDVFQRDDVLEHMKNLGVNANWDMVYLVFAAELSKLISWCTNSTDNEGIISALQRGWTRQALGQIGHVIHEAGEPEIHFNAFWDVYQGAASREDLFRMARMALPAMPSVAAHASDEHALWCICRDVFQEWYLGDEHTGADLGKQGFLTAEQPIVDPKELEDLFAHLQAQGVRLGIGTGRPQLETEIPLAHFNWWQYFEKAHVTTASNVLEAEERVPEARPLSKPHPYSYLRSFVGSDTTEELLAYELPQTDLKESVLIVGDSIADALAAHRLGASFVAVLTGLEGEGARGKFEQLGADYIFTDVREVKKLFS